MQIGIDLNALIVLSWNRFSVHTDAYKQGMNALDKNKILVEGQKSIDWLRTTYHLMDLLPTTTSELKAYRKQHFIQYAGAVEQATSEIIKEIENGET